MASRPRYEPIMAPPTDRGMGIWRILVASLVGTLLVLFGLVTVGQGVYFNTNGITAQAVVVDARYGGRADFVRVRLASGRETNLWAWTGSPAVGTTISVVYLEDQNRAKDARVFVPARHLWLGFGAGAWFLGAALIGGIRRARRRASPD
jgi:hypothetical protein